MAIAYINVAHVSRGEGRSAVGAAAYAARMCLTDERTGEVFDYSRRSDDLKASGVYLPKGAPERFRDRATLWNEAEQAEKRKDSRTGRRLIIALPHELTEKQQQQLLTDFIRSEFTRKGLAVDMNIHGPDAKGDDRNDHAHLLITTRFIDASGLTGKDRESNEKAALDRWQAIWEKSVNRQLERYGHAERISFKTPEGQQAQIHLGQAASALERKGVKTRAGEVLRGIITGNKERSAANDQKRTVGKEFSQEVQEPQDWTAGKAFARDQIEPPRSAQQQDYSAGQAFAREETQPQTEWQDSIDRAAVAYAEERRRQFQESQAADRAAIERQGEAMAERHAATWGEIGQRHHAETVSLFEGAVSGYQPGTMEEAAQTASGVASSLFGLFMSWAEGITRSVSGANGQAQPKRREPSKAQQRETQRRAEQQKEAHTREIEAMSQEQAQEKASYERRRSLMLFQQAGAMQSFEQSIGDKSSMREAFEKHTEQEDTYRAEIGRMAARKEARQERDRDAGLELG